MSYDLHDMFRDRLCALPLSSGRRGIAAMVLVEIVRWMPDADSHCSKTAGDLGTLLNLRPGDVLIALNTLESLGVIEQSVQGQTIFIRLKPMTAAKAPETLKAEITEAINFHTLWKRHLRHAIDTGKSDLPVEEVAHDHLCVFGRWLYGPDFTEADKDADYETIRHLHAQFHRVAAATLQLALSGKKRDAERSMGPGGIFSATSARLTKAMIGWRRSIAS